MLKALCSLSAIPPPNLSIDAVRLDGGRSLVAERIPHFHDLGRSIADVISQPAPQPVSRGPRFTPPWTPWVLVIALKVTATNEQERHQVQGYIGEAAALQAAVMASTSWPSNSRKPARLRRHWVLERSFV